MNATQAIAELTRLVKQEGDSARRLVLLDITAALAGALGFQRQAELADTAALNLRIADDLQMELFDVANGGPQPPQDGGNGEQS